MREGILIIALFVGLFSCKKPNNLDGLAFPSERLDEYQFDAYENTWDIEIPDSFTIAPEQRTLFTVPSFDESTGETYNIYCVYIGDLANLASDSIILYCHGQALHMDTYWNRVSILANLTEKHHYGVLMMDYRGYGMSEGSSDVNSLEEDVDACITWLKDQGADQNKTFYYGFSLGCIPVIDRAAYRSDFKPTKIILEAPLASVENLSNTSTIINVDPSYITNLRFENAEKIKDVDAELMWMHGVADDYIEIENGELIYGNHSGNYKEAHRVENAGHSEVLHLLGLETYMSILEEFLNK